ncbi:MAG: hotdog fold thioesterase [Bacteroidetes bacterium]|nr:hotdog fold thioesterase [Bacteroidota bacterium]
MFNKSISLQNLNDFGVNNMAGFLGIEFTEIGDGFLRGKMPVTDKTRQPFGILHGGASVVFAETLGSVASFLCLENPEKQKAVGLEINANHIRPISEGWVFGIVKPVHLGKKTHIWEIKIVDSNDKPVCVSRITIMVI